MNISAAEPEHAKLLIYSQDAFGLGHFTRCRRVANAFHSIYSSISTLIVTGSPVAGRWQTPSGVQLMELPLITCDENMDKRPRDPRYTLEEVLLSRRDLILDAGRDFEPDLVLVDHNPIGIEGDVIPALRWLKEKHGHTSVAVGLRDIIDAPDAVRRDWDAFGTHAVLEDLYDAIFVYGVPEFFDPVSSYGLSECVREKMVFTGFISESDSAIDGQDSIEKDDDSRRIFVTLGGGEDGEQIITAFLHMIADYGAVLNVRSLVVSGPLLPDAPRKRLATIAGSLGVEFKSFVPNIIPYLKSADLVISMGGYNTVMEILSHAEKAVIVARAQPRSEQLIRARRLCQLGLVDYIPVPEVTSDLLYEKVERLLASEDRPLFSARQAHLLPLDGAEALARACQPLLFRRSPGGQVASSRT